MMGNCLKSKKSDAKSDTPNKRDTTTKSDSSAKSDMVISIIGLDDAGKSTLVKCLKSEKDLVDASPTVGYEPHDFSYNSKSIRFYDLGGSERVRDIWKHYLAESYGFIYVIDCSNRARINQNRATFSSFIENVKVVGKPILVIGNKQDLANPLDESEIVQYLNLEELVNKFEIPCRVETCVALTPIGSKTNQSLRIGFDWLFKDIMANYDKIKERTEEDTERQRSEEMRIRREKSDRVRQRREYDNSGYDDRDDDDIKDGNPWKRLDQMRLSDSKAGKLSAYERQLIDEMDTHSRSKLSTISEIDKKSKFKNNKLVPIDDRSDQEMSRSKQNYSWALIDAPISKPKSTLPALSYRSKYDT